MLKIVVVGGGAGGLGLATKLGQKWGKKQKAKITLIDKNTSHLWKPLLHELATGALDDGVEAVSYRVHAKNNDFDFQLGELCDIDRQNKRITLAALREPTSGALLVGERYVDYDLLVLAVGSISNDFGVPGVSENCMFLDSAPQASLFRKVLNEQLLKLDAGAEQSQVKIAIVGAGATGVELAAELYHTIEVVKDYGLTHLDSSRLEVQLIEAGERILPALSEDVASLVMEKLHKIGVRVLTKTQVVEAANDGYITKAGDKIEADLMVWAAGIKVADHFKNIAGLETNKINQLIVKPTLQTSLDDAIFVIGDSAACPQPNGKNVPPRAQSAHQMAQHCYKNILAWQAQRELKPYLYHDHGTFVSLSSYSTIGNLLNGLSKNPILIDGKFARAAYLSLYRLHQASLYGWGKTLLLILLSRLNRLIKPSMKLY
ncbi:MAG: NAD(P)/FAD-dependent oxidoreductase [Vibrionaceae bacterium]